ncbi:non-ribosomal peptide synthetase [Streptomyces ficellus]|uniref:Amino acid adenylation domain-containing protein n=1 Tax=Streptomyces ficellus TaxID=1977088 RepID=A0A6I6FG36_9ACTN|nr:non-ribosomal peptide synthetase [Streptomyces ficellus]QGV77459.1 amino acid adenylation domain-containing protein [Streptomyces ficellus]
MTAYGAEGAAYGDEGAAYGDEGAAASAVHPMSFEQESIWLNDQFQSGAGRYVESWIHRLRGDIDVRAVEAALTGVVARHEPLRTALVLADGRTVQRVFPAAPVPLAVRDVGPGGVAAAVRAAVSGPLPADRPPLLRATLLRTGERDAVLAVALHHAAIDGWSFRLLDQEFSELYGAAVENRPPDLPALETTYGDYARAQRRPAGTAPQAPHAPHAPGGPPHAPETPGEPGAADPDMDYWRRTLAGAPAESAFPLDRPRPVEPDHRGELIEFSVGADLGDAVRAACRALRTTPFVLFTAVLTVLVHRLGGQDDIVLGTPVTRRDRLELEPLIGCLSDVMPLRQRLRPGQTFRELVKQSAGCVRGAAAHRHVPHSRLVAELAGERVPGRFPLFQVVFTVDDAGAPGLGLPGVVAERLHAHNGTAKFDVFLELVPRGDGGYRALMEYATGVLDASTARRLTGRFLTLLADATANPDAAVDDLAVMPGPERRLVTEDFSRGTEAGGPSGPLPHAHELVARTARSVPDAPAVTHAGRTLTYGELRAASAAQARWLVSRGLAGARIGVRAERSVDTLVAVLAVLRAGGACVPLDPSLPAERTVFMVRDSGAAAVLTTRTTPAPPATGVPLLFLEDVPPPAPDAVLPGTSPEDVAYIVYTSGSTGRPKGVALPHRSLAALLDWQCRASAAGPGSRTLQFAPLGFDVAFQETFGTWACGGTLVLADDGTRGDPHRLLDLVGREAVDRLFLPYVALQQLAEYAVAAGLSARSLREVITAGEQLYVTPAIRAFFTTACPGALLENQYGPSETHVVTAHRLSGAPAGWPDRPPIGRPVPGSRVYVLDDRLRPCPVGTVGEICVAGDSVALGYLSGEPTGVRRFVPDPFGRPAGSGGLLYRTGDRGRFRADGTIEFLGRDDDQVKIRGYRVEPGEVEAALKAVPGVTDAVVHAVATDGEGAPAAGGERAAAGPAEKRLVAYFTSAAGAAEPAPERVRAALVERLPRHLVPASVVRVPEFPLTASGKTDRAAVHRLHGAGTTPRPSPGPHEEHGGGARAGGLAAIWAEVLRTGVTSTSGASGAADPDQSFFALGGDSLLAVRLSVRLRTELGLDVRPADVVAAPTLGALTALATARGRAVPALGPATLDAGVVPAREVVRVAREPRRVLLTGATGFLGAFILRDLLVRTEAVVHCLVRTGEPVLGTSVAGEPVAGAEAVAGKRIRAALERYRLWDDSLAHRVVAVPGDLALPRLGLDRDRFDELARTVDAVFHAGAEVNLAYGYERLEAANVGGTAEVLRLAAAHRTVPVHHVSTVGVFPGAGPPAGRVLPAEPLGDVTRLRNGYAESKWVAETLVARARERGLPVTVYRPTRIGGSSVTGVCQRSDFLWLLVKGCVQAGLAPADYVSDFDLVPVDHVSGAITALAADPGAAGGTFHLSSERLRPFTGITATLRSLGYRLDDVPLEVWHRHVEGRPGNAAYPLLGLLPPTGTARPAGSPLFDSSATREALRGSTVIPPDVDSALFERYVRFFVEEGFLPPPPAGKDPDRCRADLDHEIS